MGLLLIGHPVFQMGKKTSQEAPLCGKTSENHSHLGLVSSILPHGSVWWGSCWKSCMAGVLPFLDIRSAIYSVKHRWGLWKSTVALREPLVVAFILAPPLFARQQMPRRTFSQQLDRITLHPGVLTSKASDVWVNADNSKLPTAIPIKHWDPLRLAAFWELPCLLAVDGLLCTGAHCVWLNGMVGAWEAGAQLKIKAELELETNTKEVILITDSWPQLNPCLCCCF